MCGLAAQKKPKLMGLAQGFKDHLTGLNNSQILSGNIPDFSSSRRPLILVTHSKFIRRYWLSRCSITCRVL